MNQYMNRYIPPVEFGMMHQLLFQMLLIPLTMSKRLLAVISTHSATRTLFPYSDIVGFHIFLGYWFCWLLFVRFTLRIPSLYLAVNISSLCITLTLYIIYHCIYHALCTRQISSALFIFFFAKICYEFETNIQSVDNKCLKFQTEIFM